MLQALASPLLQPKAGLGKGPAVAERNWSRFVPPAHGQEQRHWSASALTPPHLCWQVAAMEEMVIWEQHTVTLSKVSVALGRPRDGGTGSGSDPLSAHPR